MPLTRDAEGWHWHDPASPAQHFGDALLWHSLAVDGHYPGWWDIGAGLLAIDNMDAAMAGAGL